MVSAGFFAEHAFYGPLTNQSYESAQAAVARPDSSIGPVVFYPIKSEVGNHIPSGHRKLATAPIDVTTNNRIIFIVQAGESQHPDLFLWTMETVCNAIIFGSDALCAELFCKFDKLGSLRNCCWFRWWAFGRAHWHSPEITIFHGLALRGSGTTNHAW
jgi:hypothetical protein